MRMLISAYRKNNDLDRRQWPSTSLVAATARTVGTGTPHDAGTEPVRPYRYEKAWEIAGAPTSTAEADEAARVVGGSGPAGGRRRLPRRRRPAARRGVLAVRSCVVRRSANAVAPAVAARLQPGGRLMISLVAPGFREFEIPRWDLSPDAWRALLEGIGSGGVSTESMPCPSDCHYAPCPGIVIVCAQRASPSRACVSAALRRSGPPWPRCPPEGRPRCRRPSGPVAVRAGHRRSGRCRTLCGRAPDRRRPR